MKSTENKKQNNIYSKEQIEFDEEELEKLKMSNLVLYTKYKKEIENRKKMTDKKIEY